MASVYIYFQNYFIKFFICFNRWGLNQVKERTSKKKYVDGLLSGAIMAPVAIYYHSLISCTFS